MTSRPPAICFPKPARDSKLRYELAQTKAVLRETKRGLKEARDALRAAERVLAEAEARRNRRRGGGARK
jgi:hypothetical protein